MSNDDFIGPRQPWYNRIGDMFDDFIDSLPPGYLKPPPAPESGNVPSGRITPPPPNTPPPPLETGPLAGLEGTERLRAQLKLNPHKPGTRDYDSWILELPQDPGDPVYNAELRRRQGIAFRRREMRQGPDRDAELGIPPHLRATEKTGPRPRYLPDQLGGGFGREVTVIGPDGEPVPDQFLMAKDGNIVPYDSELAADLESAITLGQAALQSGNYVWIGDMLGGEAGEAAADAYMSAEDAVILPYRWNPAQIAYAQEALGLDPTGIVGKDLINGWADLVASAAGYTQAGRRIDPFQLLDMTFEATQAARRGSGGGGGAGAVYNRSEVTLLLNQVMLDEAGREATPSEAEAFYGALLAAGEVNPTQFATDWIRGAVGGEAATFQAATDYYSAMLAVLGGQTQAEGGPS